MGWDLGTSESQELRIQENGVANFQDSESQDSLGSNAAEQVVNKNCFADDSTDKPSSG